MALWIVASLTIMYTIITPITAHLSCHGLKGTCEDILEARLSLLDSRQTRLENKNYDLEHEVNDLKSKTNELEIELNLLKNKNMALDTKCRSLMNRTDLLEAVVNDMEVNITMINAALCSLNVDVRHHQDLVCPSVSFHAGMSQARQNYTGRPNSTIVMDDVITNEGNAYNGTTGIFTAPVNGTYFFLASTADYWQSRISVLTLVVDDMVIDFVKTSEPLMWQSASVHGVVTLQAGQRAWLTNKDGGEFYFGRSSAFNGFLLHCSLR